MLRRNPCHRRRRRASRTFTPELVVRASSTASPSYRAGRPRHQRGSNMTSITLASTPRRALAAALLATSLLASTPALGAGDHGDHPRQRDAAARRRRRARPSPRATSTPAPRTTATAGADGSYVLTGLRPGTYDISVTAAADGAAIVTQRVIVSVGQTATLDVDTAAPAAIADARRRRRRAERRRHRHAPRRDTHLGNRHQRQPRPDREPAAEQPQLPQFRGARAGHPGATRPSSARPSAAPASASIATATASAGRRSTSSSTASA